VNAVSCARRELGRLKVALPHPMRTSKLTVVVYVQVMMRAINRSYNADGATLSDVVSGRETNVIAYFTVALA